MSSVAYNAYLTITKIFRNLRTFVIIVAADIISTDSNNERSDKEGILKSVGV